MTPEERKQHSRELARKWYQKNLEQNRLKKRQASLKRRERNLEYNKRYYQENRETIRLKRQLNQDKIAAIRKKFKEQNRSKVNQWKRERYWRDADCTRRLQRERYRRKKPEQQAAYRETKKRYRQENRDKIRLHEKDRMARDPAYKFSRLLRSRVGHIIRNQGSAKASKTMDLIGCDMPTFLTHLEQQFQVGMGWNNYGRTGWHIDHIIPCAVFDLSRPDHQKICFHYTNTRPAWARENTRRQSRIDDELPLVYLHKRAFRFVDTPASA